MDSETITTRPGDSGIFPINSIPVPTRRILGELRIILNCLKATKYDWIIIGSDNLLKLETWVDAHNAGHYCIKGNTEGCIYCGVGTIHGKAP